MSLSGQTLSSDLTVASLATGKLSFANGVNVDVTPAPPPTVAGPAGFGGIATGETDPAAAEVAFNLPSTADPAIPVTGHVFVLGEVQILLPGQFWTSVAVAQVFEKGYGRYCVRLTAAQCAVAGSVFIRVVVSGAQPYFGYDRIGTFAGDIPQNLGGSMVFYLPNATDPIYGSPVTGHSFVAGEVRLCLPAGVYADAVVGNIVEIGYGAYSLTLTPSQTVNRGKAFIYANVTGAQVFEGYETISATNVVTTTTTTTTTVTPLPIPVVPGSPTYVDHVAAAVNRLPQQFR